jgi:hypothetical protein
MNSLRSLALLALSISSGLTVAAGEAATLTDDSPFLARGTAGTQGTAVNPDALELRGVMSSFNGYLYYVFDPVKKHGVWAGSNDTENPFTIVAGDAKEGYLVIRVNDGRLLHLKLRVAKTLADGTNAAATPASVANAAAEPSQVPAGMAAAQAAWNVEFRRRLAENAASN